MVQPVCEDVAVELPGVQGVILHGDALTMLKTLPDESVHCCVTSPPYWGLRDYGTAKWEGGDSECSHKFATGGYKSTGLNCKRDENNWKAIDSKSGQTWQQYKDICPKCGAIRIDNQYGLERTPEEYVAKMVEVFREVRRVLRKDGTLWLNLGDSYAGSLKGKGCSNFTEKQSSNAGSFTEPMPIPNGLKPKDLIGIPWRVAFALQSDGWYLRQDIIWHKPSPMPESVTDRCTKSHEYIFLLTKSASYFYDADAIKEDSIDEESYKGRRKRNAPQMAKHDLKNLKNAGSIQADGTLKFGQIYEKRNKRSVWTVTTKPFKEAHFATFPPKLIEPCILAGCPEGGTVLDPFFGAGTTGLVCSRLNREYIGIELNGEYVEMAKRRIEGDAPLLNCGDIL